MTAHENSLKEASSSIMCCSPVAACARQTMNEATNASRAAYLAHLNGLCAEPATLHLTVQPHRENTLETSPLLVGAHVPWH